MKDVIERLTKLSKVGFGYDITFEDREALKDAVKALSASPAGVVNDIDGGRFEEWTLADFAAQCRMQSRQQLDPEFSRFMAALSARIMSAIEPAGMKTDQQQDIEDIQKLAGMVCATFKPHEPAGVGVETPPPQTHVRGDSDV